MLYMIKNYGCDDTTTSVMKLTKSEYKTLTRFIRKNNLNSTHECQPIIEIFKFKKKK
ncbi:MAG: hypothetical protein IJN50_00905 [Clostridia bacterium]|nr:hypothetical protein [Clostridia bacterium]